MNGRILHFRQSRHTTHGNHLLVEVDGVGSRKEAQKLVGKTVTYNTGKNDIKGEVTKAHGNSGVLMVRFERGLPGQALGKSVKLS